jgi:poly(ribitol-phosphate) beta-N-acetylglucosaminyltransferase
MNRKLFSCKDIQKSIYCAPKEIRTCCQRFFVGGRMKGDVALVILNEKRNISFQEIVEAKKTLVEGINNGTDERCTGCPNLKLESWPNIEQEEIGCFSFENHSVCNMRCAYCSKIYNGGVKPFYDLDFLLSGVYEVSNDLHIAWGGGEPTIGQEFNSFFTMANKKFNPRTQIVFTNALKHSVVLQEALDNKVTSITTSIDAGSEETFRKVRGVKGLDKVLSNLRLYSTINPNLVTIKYIFTDNNHELKELEKFINKIIENDLIKCNFLISANFKAESLTDQRIFSMMILYWLLYKKRILTVTFDDHIYKRVNEIGSKYRNISGPVDLPEKFVEVARDIDESIKYHREKDIIVWGVGEFSKMMFKSSKKLKSMNICMIVDGNPNRWGESYMGHIIRKPHAIIESDASILVASSNYYGEIVNRIISMGISRERLVPTFII